MKKRKVGIICLIVLISTLLLSFSTLNAIAQQFSWRKYQGTEINVK